MVKLNAWESFLISGAIALLQALESKLTNQVEIAALQSAISFLNSLVAGSLAGERPAA
jgi:hypothetical protein